MASLIVKFADLASEPVGSGRDVTAEVLVSYTREVPLTDGTVLQAVPMRKQLGPGGTAIFEVTPSDDPTVQADFRGFGLRVEWLLTHRAGRGRQTETRGARTVKVTVGDGATVQFGRLLPAEPLPPNHATVGEILEDVDQAVATIDNLAATATALPAGSSPTVAVTGAIPNKVINIGVPRGADGAPGMGYEEGQQLLADSQAAQTSAASSASDAADAVTLAQQAQAAAQDAASLVDAPASEIVSTVVSRLLVDATAHGVVGDGTTNDATALNALIQSVSADGGGVIVLPLGTYMATTVNGASNVTLRGASREGVILRKSGSNSTWIRTHASTGFRIESMTIDGADLVTSYGVEFSTGSTDCVVQDCTLMNFTQAVETRSGSVRPVVERCLITAVGTGVRLNQDVTGAIVRNNIIADWTESAIYTLGSATMASRESLIEGNVVQRHRVGSTGIRQAIRFSGHDDNHHQRPVVRGNVVTGSFTNHQDTLDPGSADLISLHRCTGFEVSGNHVSGGGDVGITIAQGCREGRVHGNVSELNDTVGLCLGSADSDVWVKDIVVSGNTFRDNAQDRPDTGGTEIIRAVERAKAGALVVRAQDCVIDGNSITYAPGHPTASRNAIAVRETARVHIGAVGYGNKASGHTRGLYTESPASTGMTTTGNVSLAGSSGEIGRLDIGGVPLIVGSVEPDGVVDAPRGAMYLRTAGAAGEQIYYKNAAGTTGWRTSATAAVQTAANLGNVTHAINTSGKFAGRAVFDTTNGKPLWAANGNANGVWRDATGTAVITPA